MKNGNSSRKYLLILLAVLLAGAGGLLAGIRLGTSRADREFQQEMERHAVYHEFEDEWTARIQESSAQALAESAAQEAVRQMEESIAEEEEPPELTKDEKELLDRLNAYVKAGEYEEAARLMLSQEEILSAILYDVQEGERYLYRDGKLKRDIEGSGLVLARPSLLFAGDFAGGAPQGECTALQAVEMDGSRYDFADGLWREGQMNGAGSIGYCCYEGSGEENRKMTRQGVFYDNLMTGMVLLTTVNAKGEECSWTMQTEDGVLIKDSSWKYDASQNVYQLPSDSDDSHAYTVPESAFSEPRFQNPLLWE